MSKPSVEALQSGGPPRIRVRDFHAGIDERFEEALSGDDTNAVEKLHVLRRGARWLLQENARLRQELPW